MCNKEQRTSFTFWPVIAGNGRAEAYYVKDGSVPFDEPNEQLHQTRIQQLVYLDWVLSFEKICIPPVVFPAMMGQNIKNVKKVHTVNQVTAVWKINSCSYIGKKLPSSIKNIIIHPKTSCHTKQYMFGLCIMTIAVRRVYVHFFRMTGTFSVANWAVIG